MVHDKLKKFLSSKIQIKIVKENKKNEINFIMSMIFLGNNYFKKILFKIKIY